MLSKFPDGLDYDHLPQTRLQRNTTQRGTSTRITTEDIIFQIRAIQEKVGANLSQVPESLDFRVSQLETGMYQVQSDLVSLALGVVAGNVKRVSSAQTGSGVKTISIGSTLSTSTYTVIGLVLYTDGSVALAVASNKTTTSFDVQISGDATVECILAY